MSNSHSNIKSNVVSGVIRDYADGMANSYEIFKEAQYDFKSCNITTQNLILIMITMFARLSEKYKHIASTIETSKMKKLKIDIYLHLADLIRYIDQKLIETDAINIDKRMVESLLSNFHEKIDLYMIELNDLAINGKKVVSSITHKKSCGLCLTLPSPCQPNYNDLRSPERDEVDSVMTGFNFKVLSRTCSISSDDVPSYSPTEGLSPASSDTEDEPPLSPGVEHLLPDWQEFLHECQHKYYVMSGGETPSSKNQEYMHQFLGGRRVSSLQTPTSPGESILTVIENEPIVFRRKTEPRSWNSTSADETNKILLAETDVNKYIVFKTSDEDQVILYAELDALIVYATKNLDSEFCEIFISTHRSFISSDELIEKLIFRFKTCAENHRNIKNTTYTLIAQVCKALTRFAITEELLNSLIHFMHHLVTLGEAEWVLKLQQIFLEKINEYHKTKMWMNAIPEYIGDECRETLLDFKVITIAQQMTLIAFDLFTKIELAELLVSEIKTETPNVTAFIHHCDKLSYWVTTIIGKLRNAREVQKHIKFLVNVMKYLKDYRDFSSCWAILIGLQTTYIYKITKKYEHMFSDFVELFSFSANYKNYRNELKESKLPRIPLICIALHDLIYISEATKRFKPDELENSINFYRICRQYKYIKVFKEEKSGYPFKKNGKVLTFFRNFDNQLSVNKS